MNMRSCKNTITALALICLCPINAISREITAKEMLIQSLSIMHCIIDEGIMTRERAYSLIWKMLEEEGISTDRTLTLSQDPDLQKDISERVKLYGGCVNIGKEWGKDNKSKKQIYNNPR